MTLDASRVTFRLVNAAIVVLLLFAYQWYFATIDVPFLLGVAVVYLLISIAIDAIRVRREGE